MSDEPKVKPIVFLASPFAGEDNLLNIDFARRISREVALNTGYVPIAPHLLFPQFLNDKVPAERALGISYARTLQTISSRCAFFVPPWRPGFSTGMGHEHALAKELRKAINTADGGEAAVRRTVALLASIVPPEEP